MAQPFHEKLYTIKSVSPIYKTYCSNFFIEKLREETSTSQQNCMSPSYSRKKKKNENRAEVQG